ncbi:MAG: pilus assembly protein TadG-related protein [Pirellulales bacterium]
MNRIIKLQQPRHGTITILAAIMSIVLVGMVAFCVDLGYVLSAKEELQRSTDSAALAACWEFGQKLSKGNTTTAAGDYARVTAAQYATLNRVTGNPMTIDANTSNDPNGDVVFGYVADFKDSQSPFQTSNPARFNAVKVRLRKCPSANGEVPYFFARVFGLEGQSLSTEAVAGLIRDVKGFKAPSDGGTLGILPYALDLQTWTSFVANSGADNYKWNPTTKAITAGSDGLVEVNLFPQGTGSPGNRGTVDIGSSNNSTADIARQILHGISASDLAALGKPLEFDATGKLILNGDTGISAGVKDELDSIKGQPRIIPIFSSVSGNGNNAQYTIVKWQGIRIMNVKLTGSMSQKNVMIQVAPAMTKGVVPATAIGSSSSVFSPVVLVR